MAYKPGDFFLGVIDFFGILVPGAVLLFLHGEWLVDQVGVRLQRQEMPVWVPFLLGSYVLGHFLLGAGVPLNRLLRLFRPEHSDAFYNEVRKTIDLPPGVRANRTDAFYRAYSFVRLKSPSALEEVERQMADYKLFRSLTLVFLLDLLLVWLRGLPSPTRSVISALLVVGAGARFLFLLSWTYRVTFEYYALLSDVDTRGH